METDRRTTEVESVLNDYSIKLGAPLIDYRHFLETGFSLITIPRLPHVFYIKELRLEEGGNPIGTLHGMMAIMGHSIVTGEMLGDWKFMYTGKSVEETVRAYENAQRNFGLPPLDVVLACRRKSPRTSNAKVIFSFRDHPYIVPETGLVTMRNYSSEEDRSTLKPGEGVGIVVADASKWSIQYWQSHWSVNDRTRLQIPSWAVNASSFSMQNLVDPR